MGITNKSCVWYGQAMRIANQNGVWYGDAMGITNQNGGRMEFLTSARAVGKRGIIQPIAMSNHFIPPQSLLSTGKYCMGI